MKMILVAKAGEHAAALSYHLKPLGFTLEHFTDPVRVIERLEELDPQAILFNAGDFPRHWKMLLKIAREKKPREDLIFLLIAAKDFEMEDAAKAAHLGVNGIMKPNLADKQELYRLEEIIRRYRSVQDKRNFARMVPTSWDSPSRIRVGSPSSAGRCAKFPSRDRASSPRGPRPSRTSQWEPRSGTAP